MLTSICVDTASVSAAVLAVAVLNLTAEEQFRFPGRRYSGTLRKNTLSRLLLFKIQD